MKVILKILFVVVFLFSAFAKAQLKTVSYMKHIFYFTFLVFSINSCGTKKEEAPIMKSEKTASEFVYLIKNYKNDLTTLFGPVKYLDSDYRDKKDRSINTGLYKVYPFYSIISHRGDFEFDQYGHRLLYKSRETDNFPFFQGSKYFDFKPSKSLFTSNLKTEYSMHIKYPNQINFDHKRASSSTLRKEEREYDTFYHFDYNYNLKFN